MTRRSLTASQGAPRPQPTSITIVLLAYNDAPALPQVIREVDDVLQRLVPSYEIIVVDDGSTDDTPSVIQRQQKKYGALRLVAHGSNRGVGCAFRSGISAASSEVVGYLDGDGQYVAEDIGLLLEVLQDGGAASGRRVARADGAWRNIVSHVYRWLLASMYGVQLRDINSGIKLYSRAFIELASDLFSPGPFFDAEVIIKATRAGAAVVEVPVRHRPRSHGRAQGARLQSVLSALHGAGHAQMRPFLRSGYLAAALYAFASVYARCGAASRESGGRADADLATIDLTPCSRDFH